MSSIPCFLCGHNLEKRTDKNSKPYFCCDSCGIQIFVRGKKGRELLEESFRNLEKAKLPFRIHAHNLYEIQAHIKEIDGVKAEIEKIGISHWFDEQKLQIRKSLETRLKNLVVQLQQMGEEGQKQKS